MSANKQEVEKHVNESKNAIIKTSPPSPTNNVAKSVSQNSSPQSVAQNGSPSPSISYSFKLPSQARYKPVPLDNIDGISLQDASPLFARNKNFKVKKWTPEHGIPFGFSNTDLSATAESFYAKNK